VTRNQANIISWLWPTFGLLLAILLQRPYIEIREKKWTGKMKGYSHLQVSEQAANRDQIDSSKLGQPGSAFVEEVEEVIEPHRRYMGLVEEDQHGTSSAQFAKIDKPEFPTSLAPDRPSQFSICERCNADTIMLDPKYFESLNVSVCSACIRAVPEEYSLLTKTEAKQDYILTDSELSTLPSITRPNPHKNTWSKMYLYMRRHLEVYAFEKWKGEEGLDAALDKRDEKRKDLMNKKFRRRLNELRRKTYTGLQLNGSFNRIPAPISTSKHRDQPHQHDFDKPFPDDPSNPDRLRKTCLACGFSVIFESL
jgi:DNA-repair protein complementing XP-A cells